MWEKNPVIKKTRKALKWYEKSAYLTNWNREEEAERTKKVSTEEEVKKTAEAS